MSPGIHGEQVLTARSGPLRVYAAEDPTTWPQEWPLPLRMPWRDRSDGKGERAAA